MTVAHDGSESADAGLAQWTGWQGFLIWWVPRLLFVVGTITLTVHSVYGVLPSKLAWGCFFVCSLVFVVRQWVWGHAVGDGGPRWLMAGGAVLSTAGATILILCVPVVERDGLPLIGAVVLILGLGWWIECWRHSAVDAASRPRMWRIGAVLLVAAVLMAAVSALMLNGARGGLFVWLLVVLGVGVFVVLPLGLNVLSACGLEALRTGSLPGRGWRLVAGLCFAFVAGFVMWLWIRDWTILAVLVAATVVLLFALVSNTHADVVLVLAGLCALAAAPAELPKSVIPAPAAGGKGELVALGDSYMSGEGANSYIAGTNNASGNECRRSPTAYALSIADNQDLGFDGLRFIACSGARTLNVVAYSENSKAKPQKGEPASQIDQLKQLGPSLDPALVIISLGGNDAGFATIGAACIGMGNCDDEELQLLFKGNLPSVRRALEETYGSLKKHLPSGVPIVAVPYPQPFADKTRTRTCRGVALTEGERDFIRTFVDDLNKEVSSAAAHTGILYLDEMEDALQAEHLQLCEARKAAAGINFVDLKSTSGPLRHNPGKWIHNSLHPNELGHKAMLKTFETWLKKSDHLTQAPAGQTANTTRPTEPKPPCSLAEKTRSDCQLGLRDWQVKQVLNRWLLLLVGALCLLVAWAASIVIISKLPQATTRQTSPGQFSPSGATPQPEPGSPPSTTS